MGESEGRKDRAEGSVRRERHRQGKDSEGQLCNGIAMQCAQRI